jgi:CRP-like cAMP-binding protein
MYRELLKSAFGRIALDETQHQEFFERWQLREFKRNEIITGIGEVEREFYVVVEGVQMIYYLSPNGDQKVIGFSFGGSFSGVYDSFLTEKPSSYFLQSLTPSKLIGISKAEYDRWFEDYPEFNKWGRLVHQDLLIGRVQRELELTTMSSKERFDTFMARCPKELLTIPQKHLASYLNMTPETFSRLRSAIS